MPLVPSACVEACVWRELGLRAVTLCSLLVGHDPSESRMVRRHVISLLYMVSFIVLPLSPKRGVTVYDLTPLTWRADARFLAGHLFSSMQHRRALCSSTASRRTAIASRFFNSSPPLMSVPALGGCGDTTQIEDEHGGNDGDDHEEEDAIRGRRRVGLLQEPMQPLDGLPASRSRPAHRRGARNPDARATAVAATLSTSHNFFRV